MIRRKIQIEYRYEDSYEVKQYDQSEMLQKMFREYETLNSLYHVWLFSTKIIIGIKSEIGRQRM